MPTIYAFVNDDIDDDNQYEFILDEDVTDWQYYADQADTVFFDAWGMNWSGRRPSSMMVDALTTWYNGT